MSEKQSEELQAIALDQAKQISDAHEMLTAAGVGHWIHLGERVAELDKKYRCLKSTAEPQRDTVCPDSCCDASPCPLCVAAGTAICADCGEESGDVICGDCVAKQRSSWTEQRETIRGEVWVVTWEDDDAAAASMVAPGIALAVCASTKARDAKFAELDARDIVAESNCVSVLGTPTKGTREKCDRCGGSLLLGSLCPFCVQGSRTPDCDSCAQRDQWEALHERIYAYEHVMGVGPLAEIKGLKERVKELEGYCGLSKLRMVTDECNAARAEVERLENEVDTPNKTGDRIAELKQDHNTERDAVLLFLAGKSEHFRRNMLLHAERILNEIIEAIRQGAHRQ